MTFVCALTTCQLFYTEAHFLASHGQSPGLLEVPLLYFIHLWCQEHRFETVLSKQDAIG
jgi:hypothetical protein